LAAARVIELDKEGSLQFMIDPSVDTLSNLVDRVPVTAIYDDADGVPVYLLLHLKDGKIFELEIYKADGSNIINKPSVERLYF